MWVNTETENMASYTIKKLITNMQKCLVHHLIGTKLCCALPRCVLVQKCIVNLDLYVRCQIYVHTCALAVYVHCHPYRGCHLPVKCLLHVLVPHHILRTKSVRILHVPCDPSKNEKCWGRPPLLTDIGPSCTLWCTTQVDGAQHSPVLTRWCTT